MKVNQLDPTKTSNAAKEAVALWLDEMAKGLTAGRFRFCKAWNLMPTTGRKGQGVTCFATKTAWHIGAWSNWPANVREGSVRFIKSFQGSDGSYVDRWLLKRIAWSMQVRSARGWCFRSGFNAAQVHNEKVVRAETRQSAATLILLGDRSVHALPIVWQSESEVRGFVRSLDWSLPWGAGSHASHLVSFLAMNTEQDGLSPTQSRLLDSVFNETSRFLDEETGTWGLGKVPPVQRINGAMKMLTAYDWADRPIPFPERLIEYALNEVSGEDGCGVLDRLFVVHKSKLEVPGYRSSEIERFALEALVEIDGYRQKDGGFSFYRDRAQRSYYGALASLGGRQGDMHGTVMFTWAIAMALDLLGIRAKLGWHLSRA